MLAKLCPTSTTAHSTVNRYSVNSCAKKKEGRGTRYELPLLYTCVCFASGLVQRLSTASITFDQPLFVKAVDIVKKTNLNIVVHLGGFHVLKNCVGSVGHLMRGSGLEDVLGVIFGGNTLHHVLSGKAYARSLHGHFLIYLALNSMLLDYLKSPVRSHAEDDVPAPPVVIQDVVTSTLSGSINAHVIDDLESLYDSILADKVNVMDENVLQSESLMFAKQVTQVQVCNKSVCMIWLYTGTNSWKMHARTFLQCDAVYRPIYDACKPIMFTFLPGYA